jgi:Flp pilus assembly protein TadG
MQSIEVVRSHHQKGVGQSLVEFALVLPLILLVLMGVIDLGRGIFAYNEVSNAARQGGRTGIVNQTLTDIRSRAAAQAIALGVKTAVPTSCPVNGGPPTNNTNDPSGICVAILQPDGITVGACSVTPAIGCVVVVSVKSTFTALTPIIGNIVGAIALSSTTRQMIEATCNGAGCTIP